MKKIIACIMILALCVGVFAACKPNTDPTEPAASALEKAKKYVFMLYKDGNVKTPENYDVVKAVTIDGTSFPIEWTIEIKSGSQDAVKVGAAGDALVTIEVSDTVKEDTEYTLTATIKDADGNTETVSFDHMVPAVVDLSGASYKDILTAAYALEPGAAMSDTHRLFGKVTAINTPWSDDYQNITVTIVCPDPEGNPMEDMAIQCYRLKGEGAKDLKEGDEITVEGVIKNYNGTIEFDSGCTLVGFGEIKALDPEKVLEAAYALEPGASMKESVTLTGVINAVNTPWSEDYQNITVTIVVGDAEDKPVQCYRLTGEGAKDLAVGDTITVTGTIQNYNGTIEFNAGCTLDNRVPGAGSDTPEPTTGVDTPDPTNAPEPPATNPPAPPATDPAATTTDYATSVAAGTAYKLAVEQGNLSKTLYFTGNTTSQEWYMETTENVNEAIDVFVEEVSGGLRLYFNKDGVKNYLDMYQSTSDDGKTHNNLRITTTPTAVYTWNAEHCTVVASLEGTDCYMGAYNTYSTLSCSKLSYIDTSFPAHFYPVG